MKRYRPELWQGRTEDQVTLAYASCLALEVMPGLVPLNFDLGLTSGESLLICRGLRSSRKYKRCWLRCARVWRRRLLSIRSCSCFYKKTRQRCCRAQKIHVNGNRCCQY